VSLKYAALFLCAVVLCLSIEITASAQRIDYSDGWLVVVSQTSAVVAGCGITDENYTNYGHDYTVTTTITSPDDRSSTSQGGSGSCMTGNSQCSRADVSLSLVTGDGDYFNGAYLVSSVHEGVCPYYTMELPKVTTDIPINVGISVSVLTKAATSNWYTKITDCNVHCPTDQFLSSYDRGQYILALVPWVYLAGYRCSNVNAVYPTPPINCADFDGYVHLPLPF